LASIPFTSGSRRAAGRPLVAWLLALAVFLAAPSSAWDALRLQAAAQRLGPRAVAALPPLQALMVAARDMANDGDRLSAVNRFFNQRIAFRSDMELWGREDHWTTPLETLAQGDGDCEDYAIAKYAVLLAVGVPVERLRLVYVRAYLPQQGGAQAHMVLAYYAQPGADPMILDNLVPDVMPAVKRKDLTPVFSFNSEGLWQGTAGPAAGDPLARLSRWREVWTRTVLEGFVPPPAALLSPGTMVPAGPARRVPAAGTTQTSGWVPGVVPGAGFYFGGVLLGSAPFLPFVPSVMLS
jgi:predicted transglutaminase-like cysteine proteinase